ncbi:MAG: hypothetical protein AMXMBFR64_54610 [Myxococcales bacterium]
MRECQEADTGGICAGAACADWRVGLARTRRERHVGFRLARAPG